MTEMSEPHAAACGTSARKPAESQAGSPLARAVHAPQSIVGPLAIALALAMPGCIIPPSLSTDDEDAGVNSPPAITAVRTDADALFEPGPVSLTRNSGTINFELLDTDVDDTLVVRVFIDYRIDDPTPARAQCSAPATGLARRSVTCNAGAICQMADDGATRNMTVVVFDRMPLETGKPEFQAMEPPGLSTSRFYFASCAGPQT